MLGRHQSERNDNLSSLVSRNAITNVQGLIGRWGDGEAIAPIKSHVFHVDSPRFARPGSLLGF